MEDADYGNGPPAWYVELRNLEYAAERLRCSLLELVPGTAGRPQITRLVLFARRIEIAADNEIHKHNGGG